MRVSLESLVDASLEGEIRRESSVSSCLLDLNPCVKSSEQGQVRLRMLRRSMTDSVSIRSPSAAPQSLWTGCLYARTPHHPAHLLFFIWQVTAGDLYVCACWHECLLMHHHAIYHFFRLQSFQLSAKLVPSLKLTSDLYGWLPLICYRNGSRCKKWWEASPCGCPAGKWCDTCTGPQGYIKEQPFHVWGTRGSSVHLWSHRNREEYVCLCVFALASLQFWTGAALPRQNLVVLFIHLTFPSMTHNV